MNMAEKYNKLLTGIISGFILPIIVGLVIFIFTSHGKSMAFYLGRITDANIVTHVITLCVFPNVFIFLLFNRFDMLRASRGVLGITLAWAVTVFAVKFF
jgi:hypothetical protein